MDLQDKWTYRVDGPTGSVDLQHRQSNGSIICERMLWLCLDRLDLVNWVILSCVLMGQMRLHSFQVEWAWWGFVSTSWVRLVQVILCPCVLGLACCIPASPDIVCCSPVGPGYVLGTLGWVRFSNQAGLFGLKLGLGCTGWGLIRIGLG